MLPALSFVPQSIVTSAFDKAIEDICKTVESFELADNVSEKIEELTTYFEKTYVKGQTVGPLFPLAVWNHAENAAEGLARTTNAVEGWYFGVLALFQGSHPSLSVFHEKNRLDCTTQHFNILKARGGSRNAQRKKYRLFNEKVQTIRQNFKEDDVVAYLKSLAHCNA